MNLDEDKFYKNICRPQRDLCSLNIRLSKDCVDHLSTKMVMRDKYLIYIFNFCIRLRATSKD
jgi:hypothetical protein